jgi:ElaB/YqjD/DUF883 family membrane-anchored ribosome-binding protein
MMNQTIQSPFKDLRNDLQAVTHDTEALLKATADVGGEHLSEIRARTQDTIKRAHNHLHARSRQARQLAREADSYVRDHSWSAAAVAAGAGLVIGLLIRAARR